MSRPSARTAGLLALLCLLAVAATGCGGFGSTEAAAPDRPLRSYVAIGDGFAAAPYTGPTSKDGCLRSSKNYPALVAQDLKITDVTDVTCTGATTSALGNRSKPAFGTHALAPQLDAVKADTALVTVNIGIEDHGLLGGMFHVCLSLPCGKNISAKPLLADLEAFGTTLTAALRTIQDKSPQAYIVVVGYPQLMPSDKSCAALPAMAAAQLDAANLVLTRINSQVQSSARQTGASFVDLSTITGDHTACSPQPWVHGKTSVPGKSVAFHPVEAEQQAVADAVAAQVRSR
ncbi:MAG: hydrolase family protein [Marmoricola sp.]|nr:hydrolase family protein [Marmoricola sp.]